MTEPDTFSLAIIGGGNMARALLGGLLARNIDPERIAVADPDATTRATLARDHGVRVEADNNAAASGARVVVLAVKPQVMRQVVQALAPSLQLARPMVISVAAGIRIEQLRQWLGRGIPLVRAMPNRPALLGAGATGVYAGADVGDADRALAAQVLEAAGLALWVNSEADLDVVTALSGSGPAYFFRLAELMADAAVAAGLDANVARQLAAQTLAGAGRMVAAQSSPDLAAMREAVTSRGGTTAAALASFEAQGLAAMVAQAMRAAQQRSRELSAESGRS